MNGLFGNCGGGGLFNNMGNNCNECHSNGMDGCSTILLLLLFTSCCGCEIDWCTLIVMFLLFNCCGNGNHN